VVADPVAAAYDADGRLFVVEMGDYPFAEDRPDGRVRELIDADGDGRFESSRVFLDGLAWPTGLAPYRGGWFVVAAPDLIYARDQDGDGVADLKRTVFTGFGTQNVQALANNLTWGPDGWIHGASGGNGGEIIRPDRPDRTPVRLGPGADFRFHPETLELEATTGGGQFGLSFDDWGNKFVCSNSQHARQVVWDRQVIERNPAARQGEATVDIAAEGPAAPVYRMSEPEPWRVVRTRRRAADPAMVRRIPATELAVTGYFTSATGITVYRGTALGPEREGGLWIGDVGGNLVHCKRLVYEGAIGRAERLEDGVETVASTDNWFRPVNFANTPDGTLLILDMYREAIEHPASIPDDIKARLDLRSGRDRGRIYELVPEGSVDRRRPQLSGAPIRTLVATLGDREGWWRDTARRLLLERRSPEAAELIRELLRATQEPHAVAAGLMTLAGLGELAAADLRPSLEHSDDRVRMLSARLAEGFVVRDPTLIEALANRASEGSAAVAFRAAVALGGSAEAQALEALARFGERGQADPWIRRAVATGLKGRSLEYARRLADRGLLHGPEARGWIATLGELIGYEGTHEQITDFLDLLAAGADRGDVRAGVMALVEGRQRSGTAARAGRDDPLAEALAELAAEARQVARDREAAVTQRVEAIRLIALAGSGSWLEELSERLTAEEPPAVQVAAIRALVPRGGDEGRRRLLDHWGDLSVTARREALEVLASRAEGLGMLLDALEGGTIAPGELDRIRRAQLMGSDDPAIRRRAEALLAVSPDRSAILNRYREAMPPGGSPERGRELIRAHCASCHEPQGGLPAVGPDLKSVAGRSRDDLLLHILEPNREVAPAYTVVQVATRDGRVVSGILERETDSLLVLRRAEGGVEEVRRSEVERVQSTGLSLMPEGLESELDPVAMADLIAALKNP
jgi:putative membrane-bound dehydrogenase-like protein